ncbi:ATP-binding protein [Streptomyces purpurogeneiscleroticus]|uniref:ATP-binding protein n=1 Tax=Streptomyces purpurogeneiscleroticus TaxID=68259 RepID=UPI001CBBD3DD|nr:ATP-binding protein [Streptomyces purpurogeneiscleroticus]
MSEPAAPSSWRITLPHTTAAVPIARALIRMAIADMRVAADSDTAELLTGELVANAVEHTPGDRPIELVIEVLPSGHQHVEVHDNDPAPVQGLGDDAPPEVDLLNEGGRGLLLIRTLSAASGYRPTEQGKAVWFRLPGEPSA